MRHQNKINQLGRTASHRNAMLSNMAASLIVHKRINTTVAKAKALRGYVEPLITKSKTDTTHSRRMVFRKLQNKEAVTELFREIAPKVGDRPGGYTRIIKTGFRQGDSAEMCMIELVDFNEMYTTDTKTSAAKKTRRSRRGGGGGAKQAAPAKEAVAEAAEVVEEVKENVAEAAEEVVEKAEEVAEEVADTATEVAEKAADAAEEVAKSEGEDDDDKKKEEKA